MSDDAPKTATKSTGAPPLVGSALPTGSDPSSFHTTMAHLYRGEMQRMTVWRQRLDTTSNWAILLTFGMSTFVLGAASVPHFVMLLGLAIITISLLIEARRYRHLHHSRWRLVLFEHNYFARQLCPSVVTPEPNWHRLLANDLEQPRHTISLFVAGRLRLRRNYLLLVYFITAVWLTKVFIHPQSPADPAEFFARLALGDLLSSWFVAITATVFTVVSTGLALSTPSEEALDRYTRRIRARESLAPSPPELDEPS